jgi:DNA-binding CsgD family transcriptional regulator
MGTRERNRCRERLDALATADLGPDEARRVAIAELQRGVGFERWCWPLTDPDSGLSTSGIGEFDFWPALVRLVALEEHGDVACKPRLVVGDRAAVALSEATKGDLARSPRWRECLSPYGIGDELMTVCRDRHGCWGSVELMRDRTDPPFGEADAQLLHDVAPTLGAIIRRSLARSWRMDSPGGEARPPATLILDANLRPSAWTPGLRAWQTDLPPAGVDPEMLPTATYEIGARVLTPAEAATPLPTRVRIRTRTGRWSVIEGAPLEGFQAAGVAITVRPATGDEVADLLCKAHGLTRRERELVALIRGGLATRGIAGALGISPYTVQDHLKGVFEKIGVRSRRELISHLAGSAGRSVAP